MLTTPLVPISRGKLRHLKPLPAMVLNQLENPHFKGKFLLAKEELTLLINDPKLNPNIVCLFPAVLIIRHLYRFSINQLTT